MDASLKEAFASLPHVHHVWVLPNGHFYLHPVKDGVKVERPSGKIEASIEPEQEVKKPTKKK
ncbi:hypothetical protein UFOVP153_51 [uncultured Caudovirales phage]|uniref:Uncharacterized protein n=1 Tax=uncultured Caudovirales phage TaxID=2100421 RepID=A0A6J5KYV8_9CAUD|nr:hypothetical protein UFOVP69_7 [uncultured Caudovirales phage]CAB5170988.1 hypothetical protein UFOVP153_51 [uncultured Caudovirales phage]